MGTGSPGELARLKGRQLGKVRPCEPNRVEPVDSSFMTGKQCELGQGIGGRS